MTKCVETYFKLLRAYFGKPFKIAVNMRFDRAKYVPELNRVYNPLQCNSVLDEFFNEFNKIDWDLQERNVKNVVGFKATYFGSSYRHLGKSIFSDFLRKVGLYSDSIIIQDQIFHQLYNWKVLSADSKITFLNIARLAIDYLLIEDLFKSDTGQPICILAPCPLRQSIKYGFEADTVAWSRKILPMYASDLFKEEFSSYSDLTKYLSEIRAYHQFKERIKNPDLFIDPLGREISKEMFDIMVNKDKIRYKEARKKFEIVQIPEFIISNQITTAIMELKVNAKLKSNVTTDFQGYWKHIRWLMANDNKLIAQALGKNDFSKEELILNALQYRELTWLGNVPITHLQKLRERGELADLREILSKNITAIENASDDDFFEIGKQVKYNIDQALLNHASKVHDLNRKYKDMYKLGGASLMVTGTLAIFSAFYSPLSIATSIVGGGTLLNLIQTYTEKRRKTDELKRKPIAILFDAKKVREL
jgi:hypothetical protein